MEDAFHAKILDCNNIIDEIKTLFETIFDEEDKNNFDQLKKIELILFLIPLDY